MKDRPIILDLCSGTGAWSEPYVKAGYDVRCVDLKDGHDVRTYTPPDNVHGILAAPPCAMFSLARQRAIKPTNFKEGMELVEACMAIIWTCAESGSLKWWALENPVGHLRRFLGRPALTFEPWHYGDTHRKRTDIWGYFELPKRKPLRLLPPRPKGRGDGNSRDWSFAKRAEGGFTRAELRAMTPPCFARAFFRANP